MYMAGVSEIQYKGKSIIHIDVSSLKVHDVEKLQGYVQQAKEEIRKHPPKSLLIITDVSNTYFDIKMAETIKEYTKHNTPYVKASAVVGLFGMQKIVLMTIKAVTRREFYIAQSMEDAKEWLVRQ
jgi:hypothetical protein